MPYQDRDGSHENGDGSSENSHEGDNSGSHGSHEEHEGEMDHDTKMAVIGVFLAVFVAILVVAVVLYCCKKKNKHNRSVANLHAVVILAKEPQKMPTQVAAPMPALNSKAMEALSVPALVTAPVMPPASFGVAPPAYRSTVDLSEDPANPRDHTSVASPPPQYEAQTGGLPN